MGMCSPGQLSAPGYWGVLVTSQYAGWDREEVAGGHPHLLLFIARLLAEEEEKLKELMKLKEEQEEYIIKTQREKQVLKLEMENKNKCLEEAQKQLEEVRVNRQRVDQDVMVSIMSVPLLKGLSSPPRVTSILGRTKLELPWGFLSCAMCRHSMMQWLRQDKRVLPWEQSPGVQTDVDSGSV